jgi:hypothetical protein
MSYETASNNNLEVSVVSQIMKDYATKQAAHLVKLENRTMFLDFPRKYQEILIDPHQWGNHYFLDEPHTEKSLAMMILWEALWSRIIELKQECVNMNQPLQISITDADKSCSSFLTKLHESSVRAGIFVKYVNPATCPRDQFEAPAQDSLLSKGLPWTSLEHAAELLTYLETNNLLAHDL